jgi:hypothetical protein
MKTLVGMVTIGRETTMRRFAVKRAEAYARRHGYEFYRLSNPSNGTTRTPHWEKMQLPKVRPGFDRYVIIDDDILINHRIAPPLPPVRSGTIGLVREPLPHGFNEPVEWVGNTGFMLLEEAGLDLLAAAYELGEYKKIPPGYGDQPAVNAVAWQAGRVTRLEWKWNYLLMADWLIRSHRQEYPWTESAALRRLAKGTLTLRLFSRGIFAAPEGVCARLRDAYMVHLTWYRQGARLVDKILG